MRGDLRIYIPPPLMRLFISWLGILKVLGCGAMGLLMFAVAAWIFLNLYVR